jgi:hypothetical protein
MVLDDSNIYKVTNSSTVQSPLGTITATALCDQGDIALNGKYSYSGFIEGAADSLPIEIGSVDSNSLPVGWTATYFSAVDLMSRGRGVMSQLFPIALTIHHDIEIGLTPPFWNISFTVSKKMV